MAAGQKYSPAPDYMLRLRPGISSARSFSHARWMSTTPDRPLKYPRFVVTHLNSNAYSSLNSKDYANAESLLKKSLKICQLYTDPVLLYDYAEGEAPVAGATKWWGNNYISATLAALSDVASAQQDYRTAVNYLQQIQAINVKLYSNQQGDLRPSDYIARVMVKLGEAQYNAGDIEAATQTFKEIAILDRRYVGPIAEKSRGTLGIAYRYRGKIEYDAKNYQQAKKFFDKSWAIHRAVFGLGHRKTTLVIADLARCTFALEDYPRARTLVEHAGSHFGTNNTDLEGAAEMQALHTEILKHLPNAHGVSENPPVSRSTGLDYFAPGESPEERKQARLDKKYERDQQAAWAKTHGQTPLSE